MSLVKILSAQAIILSISVSMLVGPAAAVDKCCECGCTYKLKKVYRSVVHFQEAKFACWSYNTQCQDVMAPTSTCCNRCGKCRNKCSCYGRPTTISVPVAFPCKCHECVRQVPVVTWVVESKCEACCKKCKKKHGILGKR